MMLPSLGKTVLCPQDLKMCPDGSSVVRGPNCDFAPCPTTIISFPEADHFSPAAASVPEFGLFGLLALAVVAFLLLGDRS
jgi:hypothetical protein